MTNPYFFIVGCPRSGTTLLQRIVDAHPQIAIVPESHWIPLFFEKRKTLTAEGFVTSHLIALLLELPQFTRLQIAREELLRLMETNSPMPYSTFVSGIFDLYGRAHGKELVGNKTPGYVRRLHTLHALWPMTRFVHLIRDGRDVYLSTRHRPLKNPKTGVFDTWNDDPVLTCAFWWEVNVRLGRQAASWLGEELHFEMRYEALVNCSAEACAALCAFLGVSFDNAMLRFHERQTKPKAARPITPGLRDWRSQMPPEDVERFEAAVGDLLDELGYPRAFPSPRPETLESAARFRDLFVQNPRNTVLLRRLTQAASKEGFTGT